MMRHNELYTFAGYQGLLLPVGGSLSLKDAVSPVTHPVRLPLQPCYAKVRSKPFATFVRVRVYLGLG